MKKIHIQNRVEMKKKKSKSDKTTLPPLLYHTSTPTPPLKKKTRKRPKIGKATPYEVRLGPNLLADVGR